MNNIDQVAEMVEIICKFAHDTKLRNGADTWARSWGGMEFNVKKCKVM